MTIDRRTFVKLLPAGMAVAGGLAGFAPRAQAAEMSLGLNLTGVDYWTTEQPFTNLATSASRWRLQRLNTSFTWDEPLPPMTPDAYPREVPPSSYLESFLIGTSHRAHLPHKLYVVYDGKGRLDYSAGGTLDERRRGYDTIRVSHGGGPLIGRIVETDPSDPIRNLRLVESLEGTDLFRAPFLQRLEGMSTVRFMDWMQTNNSVHSDWESRPKPGRFALSETGIPLETMIALANRARIKPWFTLPHLADDAYVRAFAQMVHDGLDKDLQVYVEYSNEVWNSSFQQAAYARDKGLERGYSENAFQAQLRFYSQRTSEILSIFEDVFGDDRDRILGVYVAQSDNPWVSQNVLDWGDARKHADVLAIAPYFGYGFGSQERGEAVSRWSLDQLFAELSKEIDTRNRETMRIQAETARQYGLELVAYEAGQHLAGVGGLENNEALVSLFTAANRDPRMGELYRRYLANWREAGGGLMVLYTSMGEPTKWGAWGLLETEAETSSPKWDAVHDQIRA
ncbi:hypothetical protein [Aureimonas frigidaquae]|uniref:CRISPR-associated protein, Csd1 family n=1 Tax=Aureimonas frigidaquae TaxID=424757 RepID=A0A0N7KXZ0_9HYPH|nr:hypothetical protein [Aureimonas frigidaquae]BAT28257.1 CRISPR-associated protein, Csd1 family [Aureimonas frigidaquae]